MKILKKYIRYLLKEAMMEVSSFESNKWAIWHSHVPSTDKHFLLLYDWAELKSQVWYMKDRIISQSGNPELSIHSPDVIEAKLKEEFFNAMVGVSLGGIIFKKPVFNCNNAHVIELATAWKGIGPAMYDMAMSLAPNGLFADRREVSDSAQKIWKHYHDKRPEINKTFLDDLRSKFTPQDEDDCQPSVNSKRGFGMYSRTMPEEPYRKDPMNYSYNTDYALSDIKSLKNIHIKEIVETIPEFKSMWDTPKNHHDVIWELFEYIKDKRRDV